MSEARGLTRRRLLRGTLAAGALGALEGFGLEPRWLEVTRHEVPVPGLPRSLEGYTIAHVTDVHLHSLGSLHESVARAVRDAQPQLVALTGDLLDAPATLPVLERFVDSLRGPGRALLATVGNWERWGNVPLAELARAYERVGARLLGNERHALTEGPLLVATDDACSGHEDLARAALGVRAEDHAVLLTHAPGYLDELSPRALPRFALGLAGHTHGGQVRLGSWAPWVPPGSGRFRAGWYSTPCARVYVSRGIGTSILPVRALCRPELPVLRLVRG